MRERPTVATQHTADRPHHQPTVWDALLMPRTEGSIILSMQQGPGRHARSWGDPRRSGQTGRTWGEHEGSRGGRNARARSEGFRVGGRLPLPRGALPYQRSDGCA